MESAATSRTAPAPAVPASPRPGRGRRALRGLAWAAALTALVLAWVHVGRPFVAGHGVWLRHPEDLLSVEKGLLACATLALVVWDALRRLRRRPFDRRLVAAVGGLMAALAVAGYLGSDDLSAGRYHHLWDQFHYYVGAKYQAELGYKRLYVCTAVAEAELGPAFAAEVRRRQLRDLATDTVVPAATALTDPAGCTRHFSPARWAQFRADVGWFRGQASPTYWSQIQIDHGYNPPPLWTTAGRAVAAVVPASSTGLKLIASLDVLLLGALFFCVWWAGGWRILCLALVFFGTQFPANGLFTAGAMLRQDWLLLTVASVCLAQRRWYAWAGAALAAAALLRLFPGLLFAGPGVLAVAHLVRHRRLPPAHLRFFGGAAAATVVLVALSVAATGLSAYPRFAEHIRLHSAVPLTNNMGLRVLVARLADRPAATPTAGRARLSSFRLEPRGDPTPHARATAAEAAAPAPTTAPAFPRLQVPGAAGDSAARPTRLVRAGAAAAPGPSRPATPFGRAVFYALGAALLALFGAVTWRLRSLWAAEALGIVLVAGAIELTCYYYSLFLIAALLARVARPLERAVLAAAAASALLVAWPRIATAWVDRYAAQSAVFLGLAVALLVAFAWRRGGAGARERT